MLMSLLMTLTLVAQNDVNDSNDHEVHSFADRLKASHELKKPSALEPEEDEVQNKTTHAARPFQVRMTQTVARRR
ncbi:MAG TPA: hypothetical protein VE954_29730 [Oligoflexus sp.]|uniref:hypothetical protein n=1 Tax=Oligoflexus sp. TaxID=1971216 RepID=UPI002D3317FF|nr:hypothetical protein [Oligoflexus sp.]HYX37305.1 hypothetical protein [Oligoflexus sp.]